MLTVNSWPPKKLIEGLQSSHVIFSRSYLLTQKIQITNFDAAFHCQKKIHGLQMPNESFDRN